jgi:hypothetical protein
MQQHELARALYAETYSKLQETAYAVAPAHLLPPDVDHLLRELLSQVDSFHGSSSAQFLEFAKEIITPLAEKKAQFAKIYLDHQCQRHVFAAIHKVLKTDATQTIVEDLSSQVWAEVERDLDKFEGRNAAKITTWISRVATTTALDWIKHKNACKRKGEILVPNTTEVLDGLQARQINSEAGIKPKGRTINHEVTADTPTLKATLCPACSSLQPVIVQSRRSETTLLVKLSCGHERTVEHRAPKRKPGKREKHAPTAPGCTPDDQLVETWEIQDDSEPLLCEGEPLAVPEDEVTGEGLWVSVYEAMPLDLTPTGEGDCDAGD